jgi:cellulose synthase/poly-beta-1,6-N-acetylglucosamine synthase-like glycosyltransferase
VIARAALALLAYAQAGYGLLLWLLVRRPEPPPAPLPARDEELPLVSLVIAAHREAEVIEAKVADALALDWPRDRLEVVVACDGSPDDTPARARRAGADLVLELPWGGKVRAQDEAVRRARGDLIAFSDANARWEPGALRALVARLLQPGVGLVAGRVTFGGEGTNQEGLYWRYEMWLRARESALHSITAGNGAIYAVRREAYREGDPVMGHDLRLPTEVVRAGWRAVDEPAARATERMVPTIEGEWRRKRRMMSHAWPIVLRGGLLDPRGLPPAYLLALVSHRWLRYASPLLHLVALAASLRRPALLVPQLLLLAAAAAPVRARPFLLARYYVLTTASIAAGLHDHLRHGTPAGWAPPEGTR